MGSWQDCAICDLFQPRVVCARGQAGEAVVKKELYTWGLSYNMESDRKRHHVASLLGEPNI